MEDPSECREEGAGRGLRRYFQELQRLPQNAVPQAARSYSKWKALSNRPPEPIRQPRSVKALFSCQLSVVSFQSERPRTPGMENPPGSRGPETRTNEDGWAAASGETVRAGAADASSAGAGARRLVRGFGGRRRQWRDSHWVPRPFRRISLAWSGSGPLLSEDPRGPLAQDWCTLSVGNTLNDAF